tara:strand:+ start:974 stop:1210 length:237 start_codon:yes stop_codon:yes gene_type:complete
VKLLFRSVDLIAEPGKKFALSESKLVPRKIRTATPEAGAVVKEIVVAVAREYAVVATPSRLTLMSVVSKYGNVKEKVV